MFVYQTFYVNRPNTINNKIIPESEIIIFTGNYKKNNPTTQPQTTLILKHFFSPFFGRPGQVLGYVGDGMVVGTYFTKIKKIICNRWKVKYGENWKIQPIRSTKGTDCTVQWLI